MCFIISQRVEKKYPRIAKKRIPVFKIVECRNNKIISSVMKYPYTRGLQKHIKIRPQKVRFINKRISEGYHSYNSDNEGLILQRISLFSETLENNRRIANCWIPKGTLYWYNSFLKEYVSENIEIGRVNDE